MNFCLKLIQMHNFTSTNGSRGNSIPTETSGNTINWLLNYFFIFHICSLLTLPFAISQFLCNYFHSIIHSPSFPRKRKMNASPTYTDWRKTQLLISMITLIHFCWQRAFSEIHPTSFYRCGSFYHKCWCTSSKQSWIESKWKNFPRAVSRSAVQVLT